MCFYYSLDLLGSRLCINLHVCVFTMYIFTGLKACSSLRVANFSLNDLKQIDCSKLPSNVEEIRATGNVIDSIVKLDSMPS